MAGAELGDGVPVSVVWLAWGFVCALAVRVAVVAGCRRRLGVGRASLVAYASWPLLAAVGGGLGAVGGGLSGAALGMIADLADAAWLRAASGAMLAGYDPAYAPWGLPLVAGAPLVLLVDAVRGARGRLATVLRAAGKEIRRQARERVPGAWVSRSDGGEGTPPCGPGWWIHVADDASRERLAADPILRTSLRQAVLDAGGTPELAERVWFRFESGESVDREHDGDWWYALRQPARRPG